MKRIAIIVLALLALLTACGSKPAAAAPEGTAVEIIEKIYEAHKEIELSLEVRALDLSDEYSLSYNMGLSSSDKISEAAISETIMGQPYSLVVARAKNAADAAELASNIYECVDTRKWICMEADTKTAGYCGDVVMFFMVNSEFADLVTVESMEEAFQTVCGGNATFVG